MSSQNYIVFADRAWTLQACHAGVPRLLGNWRVITDVSELTRELMTALSPRYIFFPHCSHIIPDEVIESAECVGFHAGELPAGRGGSPVQNLIVAGQRQTLLTAFRMTAEVDAGPIYLQRPLSLEGLAEEVYIRLANQAMEMIEQMVRHEPVPRAQQGPASHCRRRTPEQSVIHAQLESLADLFDHIRMLDAAGYPRACFDRGPFRFEFSRPALRTHGIEADVRITLIDKELHDRRHD